MTGFTDAFSNGLVPPTPDSYASLVITSDTATCWPMNSDEITPILPKLLDISCDVGNSLTLPASSQVTVGESVLIRNVGANPLTIKTFLGVTLLTLDPGVAEFLWVTSETLNLWGMITYGAGTSQVSAGALAGYGTKATGSTLSISAPSLSSASDLVLTPLHRGQAIEFTGGAATLTLSDTLAYGGDFLCYVKNAGSGLVTLQPQGGELIDGQSSMGLQPSESMILTCTGSSQWYSVGYGRSILYQFSQLVLDVSAGGTFTLNSSQASNKMLTFVGNPSSGVNVVVPTTVSVYYVANNLSTVQSVQVKTASVAGANVSQTQRAVLLCDGTMVTAAQSVVVNSAVSMLDGSASAPSLNFSSQTNTGLYKYSTQGIGFSVAGVAQFYSNGAGGGVEFPLGLSYGGIKIKTSNTGSLTLPVGTTAQRDGSPGVGYTRFNSTIGKTETYNGTAWTLGGGATGGGSDDVFYENALQVTTNYTITMNKNAMSAGPITLNNGVVVTVPSGSVWSIV